MRAGWAKGASSVSAGHKSTEILLEECTSYVDTLKV